MLEELKEKFPVIYELIKEELLGYHYNGKRFCKYSKECRLFGGVLCPAPPSLTMPVNCYAFEGIDFAERKLHAIREKLSRPFLI